MATELEAIHRLDRRVGALEQWKIDYPETVRLMIKEAVGGMAMRIILGVGALLTLQTAIERHFGT
jgi:hypothetical protein